VKRPLGRFQIITFEYDYVGTGGSRTGAGKSPKEGKNKKYKDPFEISSH